ncbi:hypothetical protein HJFPF1_00848 [Paramyrothecium foliicola]|nr:hypothetical protein HJFPF1_00848 [Paramyrothecium foliicola]
MVDSISFIKTLCAPYLLHIAHSLHEAFRLDVRKTTMADEAAVASPRKKKLPFKPTALRKAAQAATNDLQHTNQDKKKNVSGNGNGDDDDGLELFRRAKEMAPIVAADRERRLLRKQRQQQQEEEERRQLLEEAERRRAPAREKRRHEEDEDEDEDEELAATEGRTGESSKSQVATLEDGLNDSFRSDTSRPQTTHPNAFREPVTPPPSKRSRHDSTPSQNILSSPDQAHSVPDSSPSAQILRSHSKLDRPAAPAGEVHRRSASRSAPVICLDSDSDGEYDARPSAVSSGDGEEGLEIVDRESSPAQPLGNDDTGDEEDEFAEYERKAAEQRARDLANAGKEQVDLLVLSEIPGSHRLLIKFLFNKPLRLVRDSWVAMQLKKGVSLPPDQRDDVLLTWRGKRIYNASTLLSLGIRPGGDGRVVVDGFSRDGLNEERSRVQLEAWTLGMFQKREREDELRRRREAGEVVSEDDDDDFAAGGDGSGNAPTPPREIKLRVILKARDVDDVKLTVRPETTVETLITGFRTQRSVDPEKDVSLWFDGERLAANVTMAEAEIDDFDAIEVHIKSPVTVED